MTILAVVTCAALLGSISGRVTDADSGAPIAGARIAITGPGITAASARLVTDSEGRFRREGLGPGRYQLSAAARGYVTAAGRWRESITLDAAESDRETSFRLQRGAVVAGFITDDYGEPIANLTVDLIQAPEPRSRTLRLETVQTAVTDDRGYYRFWSLRAGHYLVSASRSIADLAAERAGASPAASFYPGVQAPSQAEPITVLAAAELDGINFSVRSGQLSKLSIRVVDANGHAAPEASVSISEAGAGRRHTLGAFPTGMRGLFVSPQMSAGDYEIVAVAGGSGPVSYATQQVTITGDDAEATVELTTSPAARLSGSVAAAKDASPWRPETIAVSSEAASDDQPRFIPAANAADPFLGGVRADGRFSSAVLPGRRTIRVTGLPPGWSIRSITLNGRDIVDREVLFSPGDTVTDARIVVTDRLGVVTGTVADAGGVGATVVIFSRDRTRWTPGTRSILQAETDQRGQFRIAGVRPGEYLAAAVPREASGQLRDPAFLETLAAMAVTVNVRAGDSLPVALTVSP